MLTIWLDSHPVVYVENVVNTEIYNQVIWNNENIKFKGNVLMWKTWIANSIIYVGDLFIDNEFVTLDRLAHSMGQPKGSLMFKYYALYNALPDAWRLPQALGDFNPGEPRIYDSNISQITAKSFSSKFLEERYKTPC